MAKRFVECKKCKKECCTVYKQVHNQQVVEYDACKTCPELGKRLYHTSQEGDSPLNSSYEGLYCKQCRTRASDVLEENAVGCEQCFQVFQNLILNHLKQGDWIPFPIYSTFSHSQSTSLHKGKSPFEMADVKLSQRLANLNQALNEALKIENYEQAAWIRDRIKNLTSEVKNDGIESK